LDINLCREKLANDLSIGEKVMGDLRCKDLRWGFCQRQGQEELVGQKMVDGRA